MANPESNGRFHSDWLSMMYPRLKLARSLLADDGVIFISLDDGEVANLRRMCDEVFGEQQFVAQIIWKKRNTPPNDRIMGAQHDYMLVYVRNDLSGLRLRPRSNEQIARYKNPDGHPKGPWVAGDLTANVKGGRYVASLNYQITNPRNGKAHWPSNGGNWRYNASRVAELIAEDSIYFGKDDTGAPKVKRFLCDVKEGTTWTTLWDFAPLNSEGSQEMTKLFGNSTIFESPKPVGLLMHVLEAATDPDSLVLDFFAGASSTAAAVHELNARDGGTRTSIMVQLPEGVASDSVAGRAGYRTIADLSKERIRRAGKQILEGEVHEDWKRDVGFRVLKIDTSNMTDVLRTPDEVEQAQMFDFTDSVKADRTGEDLLFQVLLDWGLELTMPIEVEEIDGHEVFVVEGDALIACFAEALSAEVVTAIAERHPLRAVFRDSSFANDADRINAEQIFAERSPSTDVKTV